MLKKTNIMAGKCQVWLEFDDYRDDQQEVGERILKAALTAAIPGYRLQSRETDDLKMPDMLASLRHKDA